MKRKFFYGVSLAVALLLSGCGSDDATCRIDVQTAMDKGDFDAAISKLDVECASAFSVSDKNYNLALAYMGKAGYGVSDVLISLLDSNDNASDDALTTFASSLTKTKQADSSTYLQTSKEHFLRTLTSDANETLANLCVGASTSDNLRLRDVCFYYGFNQIVTTVDTLSYLTGDLSSALTSINDRSGNTPDDLQASLDALGFATGGTKGNVTKSAITISGTNYNHLKVTVNAKTFYRLATSNAPDPTASTILTDGYCDENGSKANCEGIELSGGDINTTNHAAALCFACPVGIDTNRSTDVVSVLVDALNEGTDAIANLSDDADTQQSIDDLKADIDTNHDKNISTQEMLDYLNQ